MVKKSGTDKHSFRNARRRTAAKLFVVILAGSVAVVLGTSETQIASSQEGAGAADVHAVVEGGVAGSEVGAQGQSVPTANDGSTTTAQGQNEEASPEQPDSATAPAQAETPSSTSAEAPPAAVPPTSSPPVADPTATNGQTTNPTPTAPTQAGKQPVRKSGVPPVAVASSSQPNSFHGASATAQPTATAHKPHSAGDNTSGTSTPQALPNPFASPNFDTSSLINVPRFQLENFRIPLFLLPIYQAAGSQYKIPWEVLAAINEVESEYGRNLKVSSAGAVGWMQFMPATWKAYGLDMNGDGVADPYNPLEAIFSAASLLHANGGDRDLRRALLSYNHAEWYVNDVLARARLIGSLPSNLVGALTGLTEGKLPVDGEVTDTASQATKRIIAASGAPVMAVNDGRILRAGTSARLGNYIELQDFYGNIFTYGSLGEIASEPNPELDVENVRTAALAAEVVSTFGDPFGSWSWVSGVTPGSVSTAQTAPVNVPKPSSELLKEGTHVQAGDVLGWVGGSVDAPHMLFEVRPAGTDAPRIDPSPILDGWKQLDETGMRVAVQSTPEDPTVGQVLLMGKDDLIQQVLADERIEVQGCGREDIEAGQIDRRVLATLEFLAVSGLHPTVSSLKCGHSLMTRSGNISEHSSGNAVDITKVNGIPIARHQGKGSITERTIRRLLTLQGSQIPHQIISLMRFSGSKVQTFGMGDHADHIHVGFKPFFGTNSKTARQLNTVLQPHQWNQLVDRLNEIGSPRVSSQASRFAIPVR